MTKQEAAIVAAYTGILIGDFSDMHEYIEKVMKRPVFTHGMANKGFVTELKAASKQDFISIEVN